MSLSRLVAIVLICTCTHGFRTVATVIAPTPLLASNFLILGMLIRHLGEQYSRLSPKLCECTCFGIIMGTQLILNKSISFVVGF